MQVTRGNFATVLPEISRAIAEADFIAIDTELTGLHPEKSLQSDYLDTLQERYSKIRASAIAFTPTQIGICTFKYDTVNAKYTAKPYNFYVFPSSGPKEFGLHRTFVSQVSSLEFLTGCAFDFNKWIKQGIPFMNLGLEEKVRSRMNLIDSIDSDQDLASQNVQLQLKLETWLQESTEKTLLVECANGFDRKVAYSVARIVGKGFISAEKDAKSNILMKKLTLEEKNEYSKSKKEANEQVVKKQVGFRLVVDMLRESKKPIIGHNMFLDLAHFMNHFYNELPVDYSEFQKLVSTEFPLIFDTKFIASTEIPEIKKTDLENLFEQVKSDKFKVEIEQPFQGSKMHEAGYDAFITGYSFIKMVHFLQKQLPINLDASFKNRLNLMYSDFEYLDLSELQTEPDRSHIFYLKDLEKDLEEKQLDELLESSKFGGLLYRWKSPTECIVMVREKSKIDDFLVSCSKASISAIAVATTTTLVQAATVKRKRRRNS